LTVQDEGQASESLLEAVKELTKGVNTLNLQVKHFPTRAEVKREGRQRAAKVLAFGLVLILIACYFTIQIVSYCFLAPSGVRRAGCSVIPGYSQTLDVGDERLARFNLLISQIEENRADIKLINARIDLLEAQLKTSSP